MKYVWVIEFNKADSITINKSGSRKNFFKIFTSKE